MISSIVYINKKDYAFLETLKSLKNQTFADREIIAVCDACNLETLQKVKQYTDKVLAFKNEKGATISKNEGAARAEGDILVFVDSGTQLSPEVLSDVHNTKDKWVVGTCKAHSPDDEAGYADVFEFRNKHLIPKGDHTGIVFCKKLTFDILGKFHGGVKDENKDLIKRFKKKGNFKVLESSVAPGSQSYIGKSSFKSKLTAVRSFLKSNKLKVVHEEN